MRTKLRSRLSLLFMAFALVLAVPAMALADDVADNIDASIDATYEVMAVDKDKTNTTQLYIEPANGDGKSGCNITGNDKSVTVSLKSSDTNVATVSPNSVTFNNCVDKHTITVSGVAEGTALIQATLESNTSQGSVTVTGVDFQVNVINPPPANTAPQVSVNGVSAGASYEFGSVPVAGCSVQDAEDANESATLEKSTITGTLSSYGLGSQTVKCSYTDGGGITETAEATYSIVDTTKPVIVYKNATTSPNANGWYKTDVTSNFEATDNVALDSTTPGLDNTGKKTNFSKATTGEGSAVKVSSGTVTDVAGNVAVAVDSAAFAVDKTKPVITATGGVTGTAGSNGWYKSAIDVEFQASDGLSGFSGKTDPFTFTQSSGTQQGDAVNVNSGSVTDKAGNADDAVNSGPFKVDYTLPTLSPSVSPNPVLLNGTATASANPTDNHSGIASSNCGSVNTSSVGTGKNVSCSATDNAGNTNSGNASYSVQYKWEGFLQPINNTAHQTGTDVSTFKLGSTVPVKFQLKDADGKVVHATSAPLWLTPAKGSATSQAIDETVYSDPVTTGTQYRWDSTAQQYIFNWGTKSVSSGFFYRIGVQLDDGKTYYQNISLK